MTILLKVLLKIEYINVSLTMKQKSPFDMNRDFYYIDFNISYGLKMKLHKRTWYTLSSILTELILPIAILHAYFDTIIDT